MTYRPLTTAVLLALVACGGRAQPPRETGAPTTASVPAVPATTVPATVAPLVSGASADVDGARVAVAVRTSGAPLSRYGRPPANGQLVLVTVTVTATASVVVNPFHLLAAPAAGGRYNHTAGNALENTVDPALAAATLSAGERLVGTVTFDVPAGPGVIVYAPSGQALASWRY